jgi:uncharacterized protein (UPF0276 family)
MKPVSLCGIGWRAGHERALFTQRPAVDFLEVHSENFFADGGAALASLQRARQDWPVSLHGVGLALGSAAGLDERHLDRLARLVARIEPVRVSDHASFARVAPGPGAATLHAHDLLPIGFNEASLALMVRHVQQVQERLRRPLLVENLASCLRWADDTLSEPAFFNALVRRSGCRLLLDLNNLVVNALNRGEADPARAACDWVDALDAGIVGEIHLAGYDDSGPLVIDDHGSAVHPPVWQVYRHTLARLGPVPTLIEWDTRLPSFEVLLAEAAQAAACQPWAAAVPA